MSQLFASGGQSFGASASFLPMNIQAWFPLGLTGLISLLFTRLSESSPAPRFKSINSSVLSLLYSPTFTAIHVSSAYLRLLIFLPAILISVWDSPSLVFLIRYSAYKLNKQGDNIRPWHTLFSILNQSIESGSVLTVASCPACRFLRRQ